MKKQEVKVCSLCGKTAKVLVDCQVCRTCFCSECGDIASLTCRTCLDFKESSQGELDDML